MIFEKLRSHTLIKNKIKFSSHIVYGNSDGMRKSFLLNEEMRKYLTRYKEADPS
jgi:hypothetical protein